MTTETNSKGTIRITYRGGYRNILWAIENNGGKGQTAVFHFLEAHYHLFQPTLFGDGPNNAKLALEDSRIEKFISYAVAKGFQVNDMSYDGKVLRSMGA